MANTYRLKIVRGDLEFEAEGDKAFVLKMAEKFAGGVDGHASLAERKGKGAHESPPLVEKKAGKQLSVREFVQNLGLKKHTDIVVAFGHYLEHNQGKDSFTPADINNLYYEAKLEPSNTSQALIQNIKRSYMMEAKKPGSAKGGRKAYVLTSSGEDFIRHRLGTSSE